jgi:hypothetical protein
MLKKNFNLIIIIIKKEVLSINATFYTSIKNTKNLDIKSSKKIHSKFMGKQTQISRFIKKKKKCVKRCKNQAKDI